MPFLTVNVHEAKTHFSRRLEQAHGQEIVLAKAGKPYARIMPLDQTDPGRRPGRLSGCVDDAFSEELADDELCTWEQSG